MHRKLFVPIVLLAAVVGCSDSPSPSVPKPPFPFGERIPDAYPWVGDFAERAFGSALTVGDAQIILLRTKIFALGDMPPKRQVQAFNVLFDQPDAVARFRYVARHGEPAGQLYALAALRVLGSLEAASLRARLLQETETIIMYDSDVVSRESVATLVVLIERRHVADECRRLRDRTDEYFANAGGGAAASRERSPQFVLMHGVRLVRRSSVGGRCLPAAA